MGPSIPLSRVQVRVQEYRHPGQNTKSLICSVSHVRARVHRQRYDNLRHPLRCTGVLPFHVIIGSFVIVPFTDPALFSVFICQWWRKRGSANETIFVISLLSFSTFHHLAPACVFSLELLTFHTVVLLNVKRI